MYTQFYGFSEKPFELTPDPKFLFLTESHREALASMRYGILERKGFLSLSGEAGTGKTTLIRHLLGSLEPKIETVYLFHPCISFEELLQEIFRELDLPRGGARKTLLLRRLNDHLLQKHGRDEILAIIIDEAQHLGKEVLEELRLLSNLETDTAKLLQIILVGQPELEKKLDSPDLRQLKQRIGIRRQIQPLTEEDSHLYIRHRLRLVGGTRCAVFTPDAESMICRHGQGIPRMLNTLCDNALLIGYGLSRSKIDAPIVEEVLKDLGREGGKSQTPKGPAPAVKKAPPPPAGAASRRSPVFPSGSARQGVRDRKDEAGGRIPAPLTDGQLAGIREERVLLEGCRLISSSLGWVAGFILLALLGRETLWKGAVEGIRPQPSFQAPVAGPEGKIPKAAGKEKVSSAAVFSPGRMEEPALPAPPSSDRAPRFSSPAGPRDSGRSPP